LAATAEVTPHHLLLDHNRVLSLNPDFKMYPPLRTPADVGALDRALTSGVIDAVATDHAPHAAYESEVPFEEAPRGVIGLETAAAAVNTAVGLGPETFFARMSITPAQIGGFASQGIAPAEGSPANLVVFDSDLAWTPTWFVSRSQNSPFRGMELRGRVLATIFNGIITHHAQLSAHHV
jgi:dihydroorotase